MIFLDITESVNDVVYLIFRGFLFSFSFLRRFEFAGTNLLSFTVTVFLLGIVLPIVFTLVRSEAVYRRREREYKNRSSSRKKGNSKGD